MDWNVVEAFFNTEEGKKLLKKALDKDQYWDKSKQGPSQDEVKVAHPGGGVTTQVSTPGKGGEGVYDVKKTDIKATCPCADAHVETIQEVKDAILEVATKEPKGVQGSDVQKFTKKAEEKCVKCEKCGKEVCECKEEKKEASLLEKLVKIANTLDERGLSEEADLIDQIIKEETQKPAVTAADRVYLNRREDMHENPSFTGLKEKEGVKFEGSVLNRDKALELADKGIIVLVETPEGTVAKRAK
jgi:hypothetical protein